MYLAAQKHCCVLPFNPCWGHTGTAQHLWSHPEALCYFNLERWLFFQNHLSGVRPEKWRPRGHHLQFLRAGPALQVTYTLGRGDFFRLLNRGVLSTMARRSLLPHQSRPISACPLLSHRPCQLTGTIQFISSGLCQRICCCLQRAALKHLGSCSFTRHICQPLEATVSSPGCGSPSTPGAAGFAFWSVLPSLHGLQQWHICVGRKRALCLASRSICDQECLRHGVSRSW